MRVRPAASFDNLRERVVRMLRDQPLVKKNNTRLNYDLFPEALEGGFGNPRESVFQFLNFLCHANPNGDVYLFGGLLRDLAFFGRHGFDSDLDLVVDGGWDVCRNYLEKLGARKNKFGGYRLIVAGWPVDVWHARETWAIREGFVAYHGISSLTKTTILNWDAILMNWRTKQFIASDDYLDDIERRCLDVVLAENPNPIGMAVRVFRHLSAKDAKHVTIRAADCISHMAAQYSLDELRSFEIRSYRKPIIDEYIMGFFRNINIISAGSMKERAELAALASRKTYAVRSLF